MNRWFNSSGQIWSLVIGFGLMMVIMVFLWYGNLQNMKHLYQSIEKSRTASEKMELIATLIETARTRSRLTNEMLHTRDPFEKDELGLQLDILAARFARHRAALVELGLSEQESEILRRQGEAIAPTLALQRQAADMALSEDPAVVERAQNILIEHVYPGQGQIIDYFMRFLRLEKDIIFRSTEEAEQRYSSAVEVETLLLIVLLTTACGIAFIVISRTRQTENALFLEKERALITLKSIGDAVITTDEKGLVNYLNPVAEKITGQSTSEVRGQSITEVFRAYDEENQRWLASCILRFLDSGKYRLPSNDIVLHTADNEKLDIALTIAPIQNYKSEVLGTIATFQDITKTKTLAKRIEHQARHDPLTGLMNRREFEFKVNQALELYCEETKHALLILDLDRFKIVNDTIGHAAGDELLRQVSQRIHQCVRKCDLCARLGGDEFAVFLLNVDQEASVIIAEKIRTAVREFQFLWDRKSFRVGVSIGLVDASPTVSGYEYLYHAADTACYLAKHEGRDRVTVVSLEDEDLHAKRNETHWANRITEALQKDQFVLYGQDIVPLCDAGSAQHKEVLIRMLDEQGEIVPPMAFIPAAERYNLMSQIDEWVVKHIIELIEQSPEQTTFAVNLSGQSMGDKKFIENIVGRLENSAIDTSRLCFEITETAAIANLGNARIFLERLQSMGCQTALDDFGSGLSSFAYLRDLPINYLKIDGMFVKQVAEDPTSRVMVEAIHSIGRTMNLKTIAEFVENEAIQRVLEDIGIDYAQGYHFGKPEPIQPVAVVSLQSGLAG